MNKQINGQPFDLSNEELKTIALVTLHWSHCDMTLSGALVSIYKIDHKAASDLIYPLDAKKKADLLMKISKTDGFIPASKKAVTEICYAFENYKSGRNIYAHGVPVVSDNGERHFTSLRAGEDPSHLHLRLEQAMYAAFACTQLIRSLGLMLSMEGESLAPQAEPPAWPDRPPKLPDQ